MWLSPCHRKRKGAAVPVEGSGQRRLLGDGTQGASGRSGSWRGAEEGSLGSPGKRNAFEGTWRWVLEQAASLGWRILAHSSDVYLNSTLCRGLCQLLQGVGDKIRKVIGSVVLGPPKIFWVTQWYRKMELRFWLVQQGQELGSLEHKVWGSNHFFYNTLFKNPYLKTFFISFFRERKGERNIDKREASVGCLPMRPDQGS